MEAIACYDKILEINPAYISAWRNKGIVLDKLGNAQEAITCYVKVLEQDPGDSAIWFKKGKALASIGKHQEAIYCFDKTRELRGSIMEEPLYYKALAEDALGKVQEAEDSYRKFLRILRHPSRAKWFRADPAMIDMMDHADKRIAELSEMIQSRGDFTEPDPK